MEQDQRQVDLVNHVAAAKANSATLMLEGFKAESLLAMMNSCADRCQLAYKATGLRDQDNEQVSCYTNCVVKAYKLSKLGLD